MAKKKIKFVIADGTNVPVEISEIHGGEYYRWDAEERYLAEIAWKLVTLGRSAMVERDVNNKRFVKVGY